MLAAWRLAYLLVNEYGAFGMAQKLRDFVGVESYTSPQNQPNVLAGVLSCVACCSLWMAFVVPFLPRFMRDSLSLAGGALLLHKITSQLDAIADDLSSAIDDRIDNAINEALHA